MRSRRATVVAALLALGAAFAVVAAAYATPNRAAAPTAQTGSDAALVKCGKTRSIGLMAPFTGPAASIGINQVHWANFYRSTYNRTHRKKIRLVNEDAGCFDVTQFMGIVQPSKAPFHSHTYDEVGYVVAGEGIAHVGGGSFPLRAGSCFHLPPDEVHCIENSGDGPMHILGVFHPSGSPANRTYQDNK